MKEGVPRYIVESAFPEIEGRPMFRQKRNFDNEAKFLCSPQSVPLPVQDSIAAAVDIDVTRTMIGLFRYSSGLFDEKERQKNTNAALRDLKRILRPMEKPRGQTHAEILVNLMDKLDELVNEKGKTGRISTLASNFGILTPFALLARTRNDFVAGGTQALFPKRNELFELPTQQHQIVATSAFFTQWEALHAAGVDEFQGENPFRPLLALIENGNVGVSVDTIHGRNYYQTEAYNEAPITNIRILMAS